MVQRRDNDLEHEFRHGRENIAVGTALLLANERIRVWEVVLEPGQRAPVHCHGTDYFWTCVQPGSGRQHSFDSRTGARSSLDHDYALGDTRYFSYTDGTFLLHDLENTGSTQLRFVTTELLVDDI